MALDSGISWRTDPNPAWRFPLIATYHFLFGLHSKIPVCCVAAWIRGRASFPKTEDEHWDYIPCRLCRQRGHRVKIHRCREKCNLWKDMFVWLAFGEVFNEDQDHVCTESCWKEIEW